MKPNLGGEQSAAQFESMPAEGQERYDDGTETSAERSIVSPESSPSRQPNPVLPVQIPAATTPTDPSVIVSSVQDDTTTQALTPASDKDRIEKQWIDRAKAIIAQTKDDPFTQNNEVSRVKAAYIEKRFNKKLKVDDAKT